jgi:hypothetical protein
MAAPRSSNRKSVQIPKNEGRCLDATIRVLEHEQNAIRSNLVFPEKCGDPHPVELVCQIGSKHFALEHTVIQSFPKQIDDGVRFVGMTDELEAALEERLPPSGLFQVVLAVDATSEIKRHQVPAVRAALSDWILEAANRLKEKGERGVESGTPVGVPFPVRLVWQPWAAPTKIFFVRGVNEISLESGRVKQMAVAIRSKLDKLQGWAEKGAHDVLILENWDVALSNVMLVREAFSAIAPELVYVPANVYVVDTCIESMWTVWALRRYDVDEVTLPYWDFDPAALIDPQWQA